jgi:hypothetical protein
MTQSGDPRNPSDPEQPPDAGYTPPTDTPASTGYSQTPGYPPAPAYPAAPGYGAAPQGTPGTLIAVGVILLVFAVLALLWALLFFLYGALLGSFTGVVQNNPGQFNFSAADMSSLVDSMRPILIGLAVFALLVALAHAAAGIGVLGRRGWARLTGLVLGGLGLAINLLIVAVTLIGLPSARQVTQNGITIDTRSSLIIAIVIFGVFAVTYGFVVFALARRGADFR